MNTIEPAPIAKRAAGSLYDFYTYSYPHKTAYRHLAPSSTLEEAWANEPRDRLFLYLHFPFCESRCAYCNLFTCGGNDRALRCSYLRAVERQIEAVRGGVEGASFSRAAWGGGTPTLLEAAEIRRMLQAFRRLMGTGGAIPFSVETSPSTAATEKLAILREQGVSRISLGVQSFLDAETAAIGRAQTRRSAQTSLDAIRRLDFPVLNIDLMYGLPGQTARSWIESLESALRWNPEEIFLYPLYVRPLTGLGRIPPSGEDQRLTRYRAGRELLLERGYNQVSMRLFRARHASAEAGPAYCVQIDGMVGLGCGARSYTRLLHYSTPYAVGAAAARELVARYAAQDAESFRRIDYGFRLDAEEQRRRYVLLTLLQHPGLPLARYAGRFGTEATEDFPELTEWEASGLLELEDGCLRPTAAGFERSDVLGPALCSAKVRRLMKDANLR
jgi:oxygen-independent coproporphyrinogen-3 oxidase